MSWMYHKAISAHKKCFLLEFVIGFINVKQWIIYTIGTKDEFQ